MKSTHSRQFTPEHDILLSTSLTGFINGHLSLSFVRHE